MGLIKDFREFRKKKKQAEFLASLGLTLEDLPYLKEAVLIVKGKTPVQEDDKSTSKEAGQKEEKPNLKMTPEEYVEQFTGDIEEFYPYGRSIN